jgi:hypothetical protein
VISMTPYEQCVLPDSSKYIRLLIVKLYGNDLRGSLEIADVRDAPPYEALSYSWGEANATIPLHFLSGSILISVDLHEGIKQICTLIDPPRLWIDAICVNQKDVDEMAGQIPLMSEVYSRAARVLVWLGKSADDSDVVMDRMQPLLHHLCAVEDHTRYEEQHRKYGIPRFDDPYWRALGLFWNRKWFHRLWIIQEVVLASTVLVVCGDRVCDFGVIRDFCLQAIRTAILAHVEYATPRQEATRGCKSVIGFDLLRKSWSNRTIESLFLLEIGRQAGVREPLDRVYGLFGIMNDSIRQKIRVDYTDAAKREYWNLYISIGRIMLETRGLDILITAESMTRPPRLPSWIPNWNSPHPVTPMPNHFNAGFADSANESQPFPPLLLDNYLQISGFIIGVVKRVAELNYMNPTHTLQLYGENGYSAQNLKLIASILGLFKLICPEPEIVLRERLARTLVADTGSDPGVQKSHRYLQDVLEDFTWYQRFSQRDIDGGSALNEELPQDRLKRNVLPFVKNLASTWRNRSVLFTETGLIGLASSSCQPGDMIVVLFDARHPYIIRKCKDSDTYSLVSCAYVDGVMYGEALFTRDKSRDCAFTIT